MNMDQVKALTKAIEDALVWHSDAVKEYDKVRALCGQDGYTVTIGGVKVQVAAMDRQTWSAKLVRGAEMIHLGALKVLQARVDHFRTMVRERQDALVDYINGEKK